MGWKKTEPPQVNRHTLKAQKLDAKAEKAARKGDLIRACELSNKADKAGRKGGWF